MTQDIEGTRAIASWIGTLASGGLITDAHQEAGLSVAAYVVGESRLAELREWLVELEPDGKSSAAATFAFRGSQTEAAAHAVVMYIYGGSYSPAGYRTQVFKVDRQARTARMGQLRSAKQVRINRLFPKRQPSVV